MQSSRPAHESWLEKYIRPRAPDLEAPILAAIDAFDTIQDTQRVDETSLAPVVTAAMSSREPLYEFATCYMVQLAGQYEEVRQAIERMATHPDAQVRFNAILCLGASAPPAFLLSILRHGLKDKSSKVRIKAADWALHLHQRDVVSDLEQVCTQEKNAKAKANLEHYLGLLRDGCFLKSESADVFLVTTHSNKGISTHRVPRAELESRGMPALVKLLNDWPPFKSLPWT